MFTSFKKCVCDIFKQKCVYNVKKKLRVVKNCVLHLTEYTWHVFEKSVYIFKNVEPCRRVFVWFYKMFIVIEKM